MDGQIQKYFGFFATRFENDVHWSNASAKGRNIFRSNADQCKVMLATLSNAKEYEAIYCLAMLMPSDADFKEF